MPSWEFVTVDVFTDRRFGGNPLAVFPDARGLDAERMQALAREFNLSETTFVLPPEDPSHTARVRIFTPAAELPFAGHPNVGTACVLAWRAGEAAPARMTFEEGAGLVEVEIARGAGGGVAGARIAAPQPLALGAEVPPDLVAACAGLSPGDLDPGHPPRVAGVGNAFTLARVRDAAALARAAPDVAAFRALAARLEGGHVTGLHLYCRDPADPRRLRARMFAPLAGIPEDPATGSACATLAAFLAHLSGAESEAFEIVQGEEMGRPSLIRAASWRAADGVRASVAGGCVRVMRGWVDL